MAGLPKNLDDANNTIQLPDARTGKRLNPRRIALIGTAIALTVVSAFILRSQFEKNRRAAATQGLTAELRRMGLNSARLDIDERRVATLSGLIVGAKRHDDVLELLRRRPDIKAVLDRSMVRPDSAELKALVETKLRSDGFDGYEIAVDEQLNVQIAGQTDSQGQTDSLLATVKTIDHVKSVSSDIRLSRSWLQTALQNFLNAKKWDFIRGFVTDENTILLLGAVGNAAQRGFIEQEIRTQFPDAVVRSELGIWKSIPARRRSDKKRASPQEPVQVTR